MALPISRPTAESRVKISPQSLGKIIAFDLLVARTSP
jgi:hypothetical protein